MRREAAIATFWVPPLPDEPAVRVVARWRGGRASTAEVMALRQLLPELRDRPAADVLREVRAADRWVVAACHPADAPRHRDRAERAGLVVKVEAVPVEPLVSVSDDEVVAELTRHGDAVAGFFLPGGLVCRGNPHDGLIARRITDPALAAATRGFLVRAGARSYTTYEELVRAHRPGAT